MSFENIWTIIGAAGTAFGSIATAIAVWVSLKPYRKKLSVRFSKITSATGESDYSIQFYNTGANIYLDNFGIYNKRCIVVDCPLTSPELIPSNAPYEYCLSDEDVDTINYHISNSKLDILSVRLYDVQGKQYKRKMDMSWYKMILDIRDNMEVVYDGK